MPAAPIKVIYGIWNSPADVAQAAARIFTDAVVQAAASQGVARIAISGGTTPKAMFGVLADPSQPFLESIPWDKLQLYWVDERCVPPDNTESNFRMTEEAMLSKVPLPPENIHRMEGELDPKEAASRYESVLRNTMRLEGAELPVFDLVLLGMGDDGHTASLFPHTDALHEMSRLVVANHVLQKETWRITLTWPVINQGRQVAFLIEGAGKAEILGEVLTGPKDPERLPSQLIRPANERIQFFLDEAAAGKLPPTENTVSLPGGIHRVGTLEL